MIAVTCSGHGRPQIVDLPENLVSQDLHGCLYHCCDIFWFEQAITTRFPSQPAHVSPTPSIPQETSNRPRKIIVDRPNSAGITSCSTTVFPMQRAVFFWRLFHRSPWPKMLPSPSAFENIPGRQALHVVAVARSAVKVSVASS